MLGIINYDKEIEGTFDDLDKDDKQSVQEITSSYYRKYGYYDELDIEPGIEDVSPEEFADCLAYCLKRERKARAEANNK